MWVGFLFTSLLKHLPVNGDNLYLPLIIEKSETCKSVKIKNRNPGGLSCDLLAFVYFITLVVA